MWCKMGNLKTIIFVILALWLSAFILSAFIPAPGGVFVDGNVALIKIDGVIMTEDPGSFFGTKIASASEIVKLIELADENPSVEAILFEINSPGGSAVASLEIASAIKDANKTTVAYIREVGASGGYWAASATDYIVANPLAVTGSIGVISSYLEFSGFMEKYGISYQRLVAGKFKDIGTPYRNLTSEEEKILLEKLDLIHDYFVSAVAENRGMNESEVKELATGMFYLGAEAEELNLVDKTGDLETAKNYIKDKLKVDEITLVEYKEHSSFFDIFSAKLNENFFFFGKGLVSSDEKPLIMT